MLLNGNADNSCIGKLIIKTAAHTERGFIVYNFVYQFVSIEDHN